MGKNDLLCKRFSENIGKNLGKFVNYHFKTLEIKRYSKVLSFEFDTDNCKL